MPFAELCVTTNFTFLAGASHPEEMARRAAALGLSALAVADRNSVAGVVRAHVALQEITREGGRAPELIPGARLVLTDGTEVTALPTDRTAWGRLTRLLTLGKRRARKGGCRLALPDLLEGAAGLILLVHPEPVIPDTPDAPDAGDPPGTARALAARFPGAVFLAARPHYDGRDRARLDRLAGWGLPMVATAAPLMHAAARRRLADVLCAIRHGLTVETLGRRALANAERRLRGEAEMRRLFAGHEAAVDRAAEIAARCRFRLTQLAYEYPDEVAGGESAQARLERLTAEGLARRYPDGVPDRVRAMADQELALIGRLGYAPYFLTVDDIVRFARSRGILCQGRGSAANSAVCYALGITSVDAPRRQHALRPLHLAKRATSRPTSTSISSMSGARR
ncbi:MAG: hypothetical protein KatS3mg118_0097 [Paracoccaceae bacterium]|nr:MAG: hypothetical protein KatS3mg118_0097 [Paracoccaceae bacterium]